MPARVAGLRGRLTAKHTGPMLADFLVDPLPEPSYPIDVSGGITAWDMLGNGPDPTLTVNNAQPVGDCTFAGRQHYRMAKAKATNLTETWETSNQLVTEYLAYDNGQDTGAVIADLLLAWFKAGKILGFAQLDHTNVAEVDGALVPFHGVYCGVDLTDDADDLFGEGLPWTLANGETPDPNEGHCIVKVKADPGAVMDAYVTWGALQEATSGWSAACLQEAWVVITTEDQRLVNLPALQAAITALDGSDTKGPAMTPTPLPAPPVVPTSVTASTVVAYLVGFALFVVGLLTFAGVTVPANISSDVQTWGAVAETFAGAVTTLVAMLSHHSVAKALLRR